MLRSKLWLLVVYYMMLFPLRLVGGSKRPDVKINNSYWLKYQPCIKKPLVTDTEINAYFKKESGFLYFLLIKALFMLNKIAPEAAEANMGKGKDIKKISPFIYDQY